MIFFFNKTMDICETFCHDLIQGNYDRYVEDAINNPEKHDEMCFHCVNDFIEDYVNDYRKRLYEHTQGRSLCSRCF